jgi:hypothetical protein
VTAVLDDGSWRRLNARMLLIHPIQEIPRAAPALIGVIAAGGSGGRRELWAAAALAITVGLGMLRWFTTRYRITGDRSGDCSAAACSRCRAIACARSTPARTCCTARSA